MFAFGTAVVAGLYAGNSMTTTLLRALAAMAGGYVVGRVAALTSKSVVREHLSARKQQIDREHVERTRAAAAKEEADERREVGVA